MRIMTTWSQNKKPTPEEIVLTPEEIVDEKYHEYLRNAKRYRFFYYVTRLAAGLGATLLPFVVRSSMWWATTLSVVIVVATSLDLIFSPKNRWEVYSKATDSLAVSKIKVAGQYEKYKESLDIIAQTETANLQQVVDIDDVVKRT